MQKPAVLSDITVDLAGLSCSLQPECHPATHQEQRKHPPPSVHRGENNLSSVQGRIRLVDLGTVGNLFEAAEMSSHQCTWRLKSNKVD